MNISPIKYFLSAILMLSVTGIPAQLSAANPCRSNCRSLNKRGNVTAQSSGIFTTTRGLKLGQPFVTDPLLINIPNDQSAFSLRIPIRFDEIQKTVPSICATYFTNDGALIGDTLTGTADCIVENVEISVSAVTNVGFTLNIGFFIRFDPGFNDSNLPSLIEQLASFGFGVGFLINQ
jgi:hypothetical protein